MRNRGATGLAVTLLQPLAHKSKTDVFFDEPQQLGVRNLIFQAEVVEQGFRAVVLPHHDQQGQVTSGYPTSLSDTLGRETTHQNAPPNKVSSARNAKWPLPDAWRRQYRSAHLQRV
jgi:hypothetical protein